MMAAHLARKVSNTVTRRSEALPQDLLLVSGLSTTFAGATGFPEAADSVAYEPTQGLLAVSCVQVAAEAPLRLSRSPPTASCRPSKQQGTCHSAKQLHLKAHLARHLLE